ncbi:hypothetical protein Vretifemale_6560, partial [Volvox reticuliferus]
AEISSTPLVPNSVVEVAHIATVSVTAAAGSTSPVSGDATGCPMPPAPQETKIRSPSAFSHHQQQQQQPEQRPQQGGQQHQQQHQALAYSLFAGVEPLPQSATGPPDFNGVLPEVDRTQVIPDRTASQQQQQQQSQQLQESQEVEPCTKLRPACSANGGAAEGVAATAAVDVVKPGNAGDAGTVATAAAALASNRSGSTATSISFGQLPSVWDGVCPASGPLPATAPSHIDANLSVLNPPLLPQNVDIAVAAAAAAAAAVELETASVAAAMAGQGTLGGSSSSALNSSGSLDALRGQVQPLQTQEPLPGAASAAPAGTAAAQEVVMAAGPENGSGECAGNEDRTLSTMPAPLTSSLATDAYANGGNGGALCGELEQSTRKSGSGVKPAASGCVAEGLTEEGARQAPGADGLEEAAAWEAGDERSSKRQRQSGPQEVCQHQLQLLAGGVYGSEGEAAAWAPGSASERRTGAQVAENANTKIAVAADHAVACTMG